MKPLISLHHASKSITTSSILYQPLRLASSSSSSKKFIRPSLRPLVPGQWQLKLLEPKRTGRRPLPVERIPGIPFFKDPGHTIPTRWLYRHLWRAVPFAVALELEKGLARTFDAEEREDSTALEVYIRKEISRKWRARKSLLSIPRVKEFLDTQYSLLDILSHDDPLRSEYISKTIQEMTLQKERDLQSQAAALEIQSIPKRLPRLTGGFMRPTIFNPPLPRLKPQPLSISMMINKRLRARESRFSRRKQWSEWNSDMKMEIAFYRSCLLDGKRPHVLDFEANPMTQRGWEVELEKTLRGIDDCYERERRRAEMLFEEGLIERVKRARRRKEDWLRDRAKRRNEEILAKKPVGEDAG